MPCFTRSIARPELDDAAPAGVEPKRRSWVRWAVLAVVLGGLAVVAAVTDLAAVLSPDALKTCLATAGAGGLALYLGAFSIGVLLYLPGMMFVGLAGFLYGPVAGPTVALVGAVIAVTFSFFLIRSVGGRALSKVKNQRMARILAKLEGRPVRTVALLRLLFWVGPPLNTALALTSVRTRDYVLGSLIGLVVPVGIAAWLGSTAA